MKYIGMFIKCSIVILDSPHYYTFYIFNLGVVINLDHCKLTSAVSPLTTVHSLICNVQFRTTCVLWNTGLRHFIHDNFPMSQLTQTRYVTDIDSVPIIDKIRVSLQRGDNMSTPCQSLHSNVTFASDLLYSYC